MITVPYRGIIEIVGEHDTGKTIAGLQTVSNTKDLVFVDDDVKGEGTVRQMKEAGMEFDMYIDLAKERAKIKSAPSADELLEHVVFPTIEKIKQKKHKVIIWDTWRIVYQAARGHVERNQNRYSNVVHFRGSSPIIQGLISKVARMIEVKILNEIKDACELLVITHHIKDNYVNNVVVGKIPESSATFSEVCNMRIWLRRNHQSKVPVMLFLKRPNRPIVSKGKISFQNIVPLKITPTDKHESIWDAIAEYEAKPIQSRTPRPDETPNPEELAAISGVLSPEQKRYLEQMIEFNKLFSDELVDSGVVSSGSSQDALVRVSSTSIGNPSSAPDNALQMLTKAKEELGMSPSDVMIALGKPIATISATFNPDYWNELVAYKEKINEPDKPPTKGSTKKK